MTGSILHDLIMTPTEMLKQRKQLCSKKINYYKLLKDIYRDEGYKAFYRGFPAQLLMSMP